jgi:hypothetical protein
MSPVAYLNAYTIKSVLTVHVQMVFKLFSCLIQDKINKKLLLVY